MLTLAKEFNCNLNEVLQQDDEMSTFILLYRKEYSNFEKRFNEVLIKKK